MPGTAKGQTLFDLSGGHPALDLVNSLDNRFRHDGPNEILVGYGELLRFLGESELLDTRQIRLLGNGASGAAAEQTLRSVRELREAAAGVFYAAFEQRAPAPADIKTLERLWADNLVYTAPNGELLTKAQHLAEFQSGIRKFESMKHDDFNIRVYGKTVVVLTGRSTSIMRYNGEVSEGPRRFTNLFVKMDGRWQLVSHHVTNVAK